METKEQLVNSIKEWVRIDNEIRALQKQLKLHKESKTKISGDLIDVMRKNEIDCFDIKNGQIIYSKRSVKKPITKKILLNILTNYFDGNQKKANELNEYILENREETVKETIIRRIDKPN